jgi:hypothetical protein
LSKSQKCDIINTNFKKSKMAKAKDMMEENMAISYNKLWKLLIDKKMSVADMRKAADIAPNTVTRMKKDQEVTLSVLEKICDVLDVDFGDIIEFKK